MADFDTTISEHFTQRSLLGENQVVYAGPNEVSGSGYKEDDFHFGVYITKPGFGRTALWAPATTNKPEVIAQLQGLQAGQLLTITALEAGGVVGRRINALTVNTETPPFQIHNGPGIRVLLHDEASLKRERELPAAVADILKSAK